MSGGRALGPGESRPLDRGTLMRARSVTPGPGGVSADGSGKQLRSWFTEYGDTRYKNLVCQIYFPLDVAALDRKDEEVLGELIADYSISLLARKVQLRFLGHADVRGSERYNRGLARRRALTVQAHVDARLKRYGGYSSSFRSFGEQYASRPSHASDRRVDVLASWVTPRPPVQIAPVHIVGRYDGPLSNRFDFKTYLGAGVGIGPVAGQAFSVAIRNSRTGKSATYTYSGVGAGIGFSFNRPTDWETKKCDAWLDVEDFEGPGRVVAIGAGKTGSSFVFEGPRQRGKSKEPVTFVFEGWDLSLGFEADAVGHWHRRD